MHERHAPVLRACRGPRVDLGIRPQDLHPADEAPGLASRLAARVEVHEALGSTGILRAVAGGVRLTVLTSPERVFAYGAAVEIAADESAFLYFDPATGRSLIR